MGDLQDNCEQRLACHKKGSPLRVKSNYRSEIDGLRAVAVILVILFHARIGTPGGYIGVDVFFVISGYLITSLLLKDLLTDQFSLIDFWERRIRRIFPAYFVTTLVTSIGALCTVIPDDLIHAGQSIIGQSTFLSNIVLWRISGYFGAAADTLPFLHYWSLAVEEQFYFVLPLLLPIAFTFNRNVLLPLLVCIGLCSFALCVWSTFRFPGAAFYLLPTRAWELLVGSLLAFGPAYSRNFPKVVGELLGLVGLVMILGAGFLFTAQTRFPGYAALVPTVGTAIFIESNRGQCSSLGKLLSFSPVVAIGKMSYSLYLIHWPLLVLGPYWSKPETTLTMQLKLCGMSIGLAAISWAVVETPVRRKWILRTRRQLFVAFAAATTLLLGLGGMMWGTGGLPHRFDAITLKYLAASKDFQHIRETSVSDAVDGYFGDFGSKQGVTKLFLWGDSHAQSLFPAIDAVCCQQNIAAKYAIHSATAPLLKFYNQDRFSLMEQSPRYNEEVVQYIVKHHIPVVIMAAIWNSYQTGPSFTSDMVDTIKTLTSSGSKVIVVRDVPAFQYDVPYLLARAVHLNAGSNSVAFPVEEHRQANKVADRLFDSLAADNVIVLDPTLLFLDERQQCRGELAGNALYRDSNHLSVSGAMRLVPLFESAIRNVSSVE